MFFPQFAFFDEDFEEYVVATHLADMGLCDGGTCRIQIRAGTPAPAAAAPAAAAPSAAVAMNTEGCPFTNDDDEPAAAGEPWH